VVRYGVIALLLTFLLAAGPVAPVSSDLARWRREAAAVTIVRDDWGIAHVHGRTDADAVFGMIYAQAEDDFNRVESNYLDALGRHAEAEGKSAIWEDLRAKLYADPAVLRADYAASPAWLKSLMDAWADGLNFYLATHPAVHPRAIVRFEPWMALSFTEGSIGGDIEDISLRGLRAFYDGGKSTAMARVTPLRRESGSNGIAIAPSNAKNGHTLLLINPHTSFYFRSELQMSSDAGLDAYGAATWGQFFIYQGFNRHAGWMHTSTGANNVDFYAETIVRRGGKLFYRYGSALLPVAVSTIAVHYRTAAGTMAQRVFTVYRTKHGPIVGKMGGKWISVSLMDKPIAALSQSYLRTKTTGYASYAAIAEKYMANSSNNTIFADDKGQIAFLMPQFIPLRDNRFDFTKPVDGSNPATDWHGLTPISAMPNDVDPRIGYVFNSNDWPYSAAGPDSASRARYPRYMDTAGENMRGIHDRLLVNGRHDFTLDSLRAAAFDSYLPAFAGLIPRLVSAYDALAAGDPLRARLASQIGVLRSWNDRWGASSIATTLAVYWGDALLDAVGRGERTSAARYARMLDAPAHVKLAALGRARDRLVRDFGTWRTPWGTVNRFQRIDDALVQHFDDRAPSIPVPFTSGFWGSLAAFYTVQTGTKRRYGVEGNSFVAVVSFGPHGVRARAVTAGGESGHPSSPHFNDEAVRYASGDLRKVYFYRRQLAGHTERTYHPGS
jgi:acyl-homoserine-lactone acylase